MTARRRDREGSVSYRTLRERILRIDLRPGMVLDEARLVEQLKVSRTPIREAIIQLIADGLVVREGRSVRVAPLDVDQIPPLYDALLISSRMVHRLAAEFRTPDELDEIRRHMEAFEAAIEPARSVELTETNFEFHRAISTAAHNRYFSEFYERVLTETLRFARACFDGASYGTANLEPHLATTAQQHRAIFTAIEAGDSEAADELAVVHYKLTRSRLDWVLKGGAGSLLGHPDLTVTDWSPAQVP